MTKQIAELEVKRVRLHDYILMKLEERDYHAIADAAMDLRELEVKIELFKETAINLSKPLEPGSIQSTTFQNYKKD